MALQRQDSRKKGCLASEAFGNCEKLELNLKLEVVSKAKQNAKQAI